MVFLNRASSNAIFQSEMKSELGLSAEQTCRYYSSLSFALIEIVQGTQQFMAHKKSLIIAKGASDAHDFLLPQFYREALNLQWHLCQLEPTDDWIVQLKKDTSVSLIYEDHPITGELFPWQKLDQYLNDKKIYSVRISYSSHLRKQLGEESLDEIKPYSIRLCVGANGVVLAKLGSRFKVPSLFSHTLALPRLSQVLSSFSNGYEINPQVIADFEGKIISLQGKVWNGLGQRSFDRSTIYFENLNADFLRQFLLRKIPQLQEEIWTLVDCNAGTSRALSSWWNQGPDFVQQRGLIVFSVEAIKNPNLLLSLEQGLNEVQSHSWDW